MGNPNNENSVQTLGRWFVTGCGLIFLLFGMSCLTCTTCATLGSSKKDDTSAKVEVKAPEDNVPRNPMSGMAITEIYYTPMKVTTDKVFGKNKSQVRSVAGKPEESGKGEDGKAYDAYTYNYTTLFVKYNKKGYADEIEIWATGDQYITPTQLSKWLSVDASKVNARGSKCSYCYKLDKYNGGECMWKPYPSSGCTEFVLTPNR